jgi:hypothetical protein
MNTEDLIADLTKRPDPVPAGAVLRILLAGIGVGVGISFVILIVWLGLRPDLARAIMTAAYWMKFTFTAATSALAIGLVDRLGRPGRGAGALRGLIFLPLLAVTMIASVQLLRSPASAAHALIMGGSASVCSWHIVVLSLPIFAGTFLSVRKLAPTRLIAAGAAAGTLAGAAGAWVYAFYCGESAAPFVAIWYSIGIACVTALGALLGRFALRW